MFFENGETSDPFSSYWANFGLIIADSNLSALTICFSCIILGDLLQGQSHFFISILYTFAINSYTIYCCSSLFLLKFWISRVVPSGYSLPLRLFSSTPIFLYCSLWFWSSLLMSASSCLWYPVKGAFRSTITLNL